MSKRVARPPCATIGNPADNLVAAMYSDGVTLGIAESVRWIAGEVLNALAALREAQVEILRRHHNGEERGKLKSHVRAATEIEGRINSLCYELSVGAQAIGLAHDCSPFMDGRPLEWNDGEATAALRSVAAAADGVATRIAISAGAYDIEAALNGPTEASPAVAAESPSVSHAGPPVLGSEDHWTVLSVLDKASCAMSQSEIAARAQIGKPKAAAILSELSAAGLASPAEPGCRITSAGREAITARNARVGC